MHNIATFTFLMTWFKLVSSAFALLFTEISVVRGTEISVKSSAKGDETSTRMIELARQTFMPIENPDLLTQ